MKEFKEYTINMMDQDKSVFEEMARSQKLCFEINKLEPNNVEARKLTNDLLGSGLDDSSIIYGPIRINLGKNVYIGKNVFIMEGFQAMAAGGVVIEDGCQISLNCVIATNNHDFYDHNILICKPVHIKKNAWLGVNVTIRPGVTIGENAVIGAGSVVVRDIPNNVVAVGNPARVVKILDPKKFDKKN